jgi:cytochrome c oxidase subunit II
MRKFRLIVLGAIAVTAVRVILAGPLHAADDAQCAVDLEKLPADRLVPALERLRQMNCDLEKAVGQLKQRTPEAWRLLQLGDAQALPPPDLVVAVTGRQYAWRSAYRWPEGSGHAKSEPCTADGTVVVPHGKRVQLIVTSDDVIHELNVPALGVSTSGVPGRVTTVTLDTAKAGTFTGGATRTSGPRYAEMAIEVRVLEPAAYAVWERETLRSKGCGRP